MDEETNDRLQQYCQHCGSRIRTDNAFCVSCGKSLSEDSSTSETGARSAYSKESHIGGSAQTTANGQDITPYILIAAIALITIYLIVIVSAFWGMVFAILAVISVGLLRQSQGKQTEFEKQVFEKLPEYKQSAQKASAEAGSRYREWAQARTTRLQEEARNREIDRELSENRVALERYRTLFRKAGSGAQYFLDWWRAYADDEAKENSSVPSHLNTLRERSEAGLQKVEEAERSLTQYSGSEEFAEQAKIYLNNLKVDQENFSGPDTIFTPLVAVHNSVKDIDGWVRFQKELEEFAKNLEDLLNSPAVKTEAANRVRFPDPATYSHSRQSHCSRCGKENLPEANFCFSCGTSLGNVGQAALSNSFTSGTTFVLLSIPFAIVSLFIFPPIFGGLGIFFGYKATQAGNGGGGIAMMVVSGACLLFGMLSGFMYWGY